MKIFTLLGIKEIQIRTITYKFSNNKLDLLMIMLCFKKNVLKGGFSTLLVEC